MKYCLPIIKQTKREVLQAVTTHLDRFSYFEVWLDYVSDCDDAFIRQLVDLLHEKLMFVFRRQNLEPMRMEYEKRLHVLSLLAHSPVLIDLDFESQRQELEYAREKQLNVKIIASHHNYRETPSRETLDEIIAKMSECHPAVYKIATMCNDEKDALRLLELQRDLKENNFARIILGMGQAGVITRIFGSLWGNEMIFAPEILAEQSAPGQLTRSELESIFKLLSR